MTQDLNGNKNFFWKEVSKANGGKVESCSRVAKDLESVFWGFV